MDGVGSGSGTPCTKTEGHVSYVGIRIHGAQGMVDRDYASHTFSASRFIVQDSAMHWQYYAFFRFRDPHDDPRRTCLRNSSPPRNSTLLFSGS